MQPQPFRSLFAPVGDWRERTAFVTAMMRDLSCRTDPEEMVREYAARMKRLVPMDRTLSISRRGLTSPFYRITRSDLWAEPINPWKDKDRLPVLQGGLLARLLYNNIPLLDGNLILEPDEPAAEHLAGFRTLIAIPHFDQGSALNMVIHLRREANAFAPEELPELVLLSNLFGRLTHGLVLTGQLQRANEDLEEQYRLIASLTDTTLVQAVQLKESNDTLEQRVLERTRQLHEANLDSIYMLAVASEVKDDDTGQHVRRIQHYASLLAQRLGADEATAERIGYSALLHDVGKIHVPDHILRKPSALTLEERLLMQQHTVIGERILTDKPFFSSARRIARSHHENWDGSGYPDRLKGEEIPLEARIVRVADVYDALTHRRVYKEAWRPEDAVAEIRRGAGESFDPRCVEAFSELIHEKAWREPPASAA